MNNEISNNVIVEQMAKAYLNILQAKKEELERALEGVKKELEVCSNALISLEKRLENPQ